MREAQPSVRHPVWVLTASHSGSSLRHFAPDLNAVPARALNEPVLGEGNSIVRPLAFALKSAP
jgi:hypothetical protein